MSRTTVEVPLKTNNVDDVLRIITSKLEEKNYKQKIVDGETVWAKGDGVMMAMRCIGFVFTETSVIIQGWMKEMLFGEKNLDGFSGRVFKKGMKELIDEMRTEITVKGL